MLCGSGGRGKGANKWNETGTKTGVLSTCSRFNIGKTVKQKHAVFYRLSAMGGRGRPVKLWSGRDRCTHTCFHFDRSRCRVAFSSDAFGLSRSRKSGRGFAELS
jgi:hypothetical protein